MGEGLKMVPAATTEVRQYVRGSTETAVAAVQERGEREELENRKGVPEERKIALPFLPDLLLRSRGRSLRITLCSSPSPYPHPPTTHESNLLPPSPAPPPSYLLSPSSDPFQEILIGLSEPP